MDWIDYYNILILIHLILQLLAGIFIFYKTCKILKLKKILTKATPTMLLYFFFLAALSFSLAIYSFFAMIFWRPEEILADQTALYIIGIIPWILICINPVFEFCLCIERCLTISFPFQYWENSKKLMAFCTFLFSIFCLSLNIWLNDLATLPKFAQPLCRFFTCFTIFMPKRFLLPFKIFISTSEGLAAIFLLFLLKYKTLPFVYAKNKARNMAMLIIISTTIIFEFTPNLIDEIISLINDNVSLVTYLGPYRSTLSSLSIIINILMYSKVFNERRRRINIVQITPKSKK